MTKREQLLARIEYCGYHDDATTATRIYCENRISRDAYNQAYGAGVRKRKSGMKCNCEICKDRRED